MDSSGRKRGKSWTQHQNKVNKDMSVTSSVRKYARGSMKFINRSEKHKNLKRTLRETQDIITDSAIKNASTEVLLSTDVGFLESDEKKVFKIKQQELRQHVDMNTNRSMLDLHLTLLGPYMINYSRNGRHQLFGGRKGHVATMDSHKGIINMEMQLQEAVYDVQYLHDETLFAVAQSKYIYIYDYKGVEIHCLKRHERPYALDFLPYHFLLVTTGHSGWIKWHDVSTGQFVGGFGTGYGSCKVLTHNPQNAVSYMGHDNGVVTLWSPMSGKSLVSVFAHKATVTDVAINREGTSMVTSGLDGFVKVWDLRMYKQLHAFKSGRPVASLDVSDTGLLALGIGRSVQVLQHAFSNPSDVTYLQHELIPQKKTSGSSNDINSITKNLASSMLICDVKFRPFEDVLSIGHSHGITDIAVPGSGEIHFDSYESNPYINPKQRRESEIKSLLGKLQPEMIQLDAKFVGAVKKGQQFLDEDHNEVSTTANKLKESKVIVRKRARGRNKISAKLRRRQKNVVDASAIKLKEKLRKKSLDGNNRAHEVEEKSIENSGDKYDALSRFTSVSFGATDTNQESRRRIL